ncbi:MAG TPA: ribonuclease III [Candidatus Marinimicrobia bacterium]|nr:ribonuclease III [Candidatus Neomarinimicrobiota bacterium]MDP7121338.1 ribonuclease III [Candidatus Neomarinimicrobiota bacterium]MDP7483935.1 ribonuclease III [Candidatus Neomarinimicrobiota bacterium]MDP7527786.1 ribonuclease III [Candidatus Neomarinimicrobiota bacterium]MDP7715502.1 ribonuclease III [Candidatus Neomarinimicrobiota bacterium]
MEGLSLLKKFYRRLIWRFVHKDGQLIELQHALNYFFRNSFLLNTALTHKSKNSEVTGNYEQLEFLGDAILDQVVSDLLIREFPQAREGLLTQRRSTLVQKGYLAKMGASLNLLKYITAGPSLDLNHPKVSEKQLANVFESIIGAMRLDGGFEPCINLIYNTVWNKRREAWKTLNYKGLLIEHCQANGTETPRFIVTDTEGAEHEKIFEVTVKIDRKIYASASGPTKKVAEQAASQITLESFKS